jgi:hypothetical protein
MSDKVIYFDENTTTHSSPVELDHEQDAKLVKHGYEPICINPHTKTPAATGWRKGEITSERIAAERANFPNSSTGLRTGRFCVVDIDIVSEEHWPTVAKLAFDVLGETTLLRRGSKGIALAYRNETPLKKISITHVDPTKNKRKPVVEILGLGNQLASFGIHPTTKKPYEWTQSDNDPDLPDKFSPLTVPLNALPEVTPVLVREFVTQAANLLTRFGYRDVKTGRDTGKQRDPSPYTRAPVSARLLRELLSCVYVSGANKGKAVFDAAGSREEWRDTIAAIHAANISGDEDKSICKTIALEFSRGELDPLGRFNDSRPDNYVSDEDVLKTFDTLPPKEGGLTIGTLFKRAKDAGWKGNPFDAGLTVKCQERLSFSPNNLPAIAGSDPVHRPVILPDIGNHGAPKATAANARGALQAMGLQCSHDVFHDRLIVEGRILNEWVGPVTDEIIARLCRMTYEAFKFEPDPKKMQLAVQQLCFENKFNPVVDYLEGLQWDGGERIETWLIKHVGAPDTPFVRAVSRIMLIAAVRRARRPGCKFDEIVVLEGREGMNKSSLIELMAGPENFSDQSILAADDRKQQEQMAGVWLYEIADLTGIRGAEVEKIKAFASRQEDRCRPAYGHFLKHQKRQGILIATTNDANFLQSQTGNRRWWPVPVTKACDLKALAADRPQLWAEAAKLEAEGASNRLPKELWDAAGQEQEKRRLAHPWEDILATVKGEKFAIPGAEEHEERILSTRLLTEKLKLEPSQQNGSNGKTVKQIMLRLGWSYKAAIRIGDYHGGGYVRTIKGKVPAEPASSEELPPDPFEGGSAT